MADITRGEFEARAAELNTRLQAASRAGAPTGEGGPLPSGNKPLRSVARREDAWSAIVPGGPKTVSRIIKDLTDGNVADFVRAYDDTEKDAEIIQNIETRKDAVLACPTEIIPADDSDKAGQIAESIRDIWEGIPALDETLRDLLDAIPLGFALAQIILSDEPIGGLWRVARLDTIDPAALSFRKDSKTIDFPRLFTEDYSPNGLDLEDYRDVLIFHQRRKRGSCLRSGLMRTLLWYALFQRFNLASWIRFNEKFADPLLLGRYPQGATPADRDSLLSALKGLGSDARGIISDNTNIEAIETNRAGSVLAFEKFKKMVDEAITKVVLGQTKTSMGEGGSYALAKVHLQVLGTKTAADISSLSESLNDQLIKRLVLWNYGPAALDLAPKLLFVYQDPAKREQEAKALDTAVKLGVKVPVRHARKILNIPEPEEGEEVLEPGQGAGQSPFGASQPVEPKPWLR